MNEAGSRGYPFLFVVDFEMQNGLFVENPMKQSAVLFRTPHGCNISVEDIYQKSKSACFIADPILYAEYKRRFDVVMAGLKRGDSFLTNLTVATPVSTDLTFDEIFMMSTSPYALLLPGEFVCFSPERFVKIANGCISTNPRKGTINADLPDAEQRILSDKKETAEHYTIVDLLRNDLSIVATDVHVERFRYVERINTGKRNILQVSSEIVGKLNGGYSSHLGDIIFGMLPAGSVSGAPKKATVDIIRNAEQEARGYYTGVFGYFDGTELDTAVLIRFIEQKDGQLFFRSGGGITVYSDAESEYNETLEKIYLPFL